MKRFNSLSPLCYIVIITVSGFLFVAHGHVCVLNEIQQTERRRWALPYQERCLCKAVIAGNWRTNCHGTQHNEEDIWFVDHPSYLIHAGQPKLLSNTCRTTESLPKVCISYWIDGLFAVNHL